MTTAYTEAGAENPASEQPRRPGRTGLTALWIFAAIPASLALLAAIRAPRMHVLLDYWHVLAKITDDHGNLLLGQVFTYHLDQPFVVPSLLFWADAAWFGGDNRVLTVLSVLLAAGIVLALHTMLPASLSPAVKTATTAGFSWLLLTSHATELWVQGTNGISWLPAVFFCVVALACAHRGRHRLAIIAAALGCLSFGAALPIWFALALIAWLRRDSVTAVVMPAALGFAVLGFWFLTKPAGPQSLATSAVDPDGRLSVVAAALGGLWSANLAALAIIAGAATSGALALLSARSVLDRRIGDAGWLGLAGYALAVAILLGLGRTTAQLPGGNVGLVSRYALAAALATSAALALLVAHRPQWPFRYVVAGVIAVSLATHAIGGVKADQVRRDYAPLALSAVALRVDSPAALDALRIQRAAAPAARALHAYPFTAEFSLGCPRLELGSQVDMAAATPMPGPATTGTTRGAVDPATGPILTGWATIDGTTPDCLLVADGTGTIVGGGIVGLPRGAAQPMSTPDGAAWQAVAAPNVTAPVVLAVKGARFYRL
ncbi:MAG TPA: DUF2079 domain-containing protein [Amycolatopsis sp.]|nr:DUF2079 domain-containing protein [Amycolatopsis sp.]